MPFTRIEAVNRILRAGGGSPVNSLGTGSDSSNLAEASLVDAIKSLQVEAQVFNTVRTTLIPNINEQIPLDAAVIAVDGRVATRDDDISVVSPSTGNNGINVGAAGGSSAAADAEMDVTLRSGFLYDLRNNTDRFLKNVLVWLTTEFAYEDCPSHVQEYAIAMAAREYQMEHQGDQISDGLLAQKELTARTTYNRIETLQTDANHFTRLRNTTLITVGSRLRRRTHSVIR